MVAHPPLLMSPSSKQCSKKARVSSVYLMNFGWLLLTSAATKKGGLLDAVPTPDGYVHPVTCDTPPKIRVEYSTRGAGKSRTRKTGHFSAECLYCIAFTDFEQHATTRRAHEGRHDTEHFRGAAGGGPLWRGPRRVAQGSRGRPARGGVLPLHTAI